MSYLSRLDDELRRLRVPRARRRRILMEAHDHLLEAGHEGSVRFGDPGAIARRFAEDSASASSRTAAYSVVAAVVVTLALWGAISLDIRSHAWLNTFPESLIAVLALQVAFVAAAVSLAGTLRSAGLALVTRANALAVSALAVALAMTAVEEAQHFSPARARAWELAVATGLVAACALTLAAAAVTVRAAFRAAPASTGDGAAWLVLRHPWRVGTGVAGCAFVAISLGGLAQGGDPSPFVGLAEALAIVTGLALFGRVLGLRR